MLIDSIMGTIDHIYCDNTFHVITEQNHRRNTIVRRHKTSSHMEGATCLPAPFGIGHGHLPGLEKISLPNLCINCKLSQINAFYVIPLIIP